MSNKDIQALNAEELEYLNNLLNKVKAGDANILQQLESVVYEERYVDIIEFVESKHYLNLRGKAFNKVLQILWEIDKPNIREVYLCLAKGSGKSFMSSIMLARGIYWLLNMRDPITTLGLAPGSSIYCLNVSVSSQQARDVIFRDLCNRINDSPWFKGKYKERKTDIQFMKNIAAVCGHSQSTSFLGYNTAFGIMDEADFQLDNNKRSVAKELYTALKGSMFSRFANSYKLISISSPKDPDGYILSSIDRVKQTGSKFEFLEYQDFRALIAKDTPNAIQSAT